MAAYIDWLRACWKPGCVARRRDSAPPGSTVRKEKIFPKCPRSFCIRPLPVPTAVTPKKRPCPPTPVSGITNVNSARPCCDQKPGIAACFARSDPSNAHQCKTNAPVVARRDHAPEPDKKVGQNGRQNKSILATGLGSYRTRLEAKAARPRIARCIDTSE